MDTLTVNGRSYAVIKLLGKGKGGYSYLALDGAREVVVKQIHHEPCAYYQFGDKIGAEIRDYRRLQDIGIRLPEMIDVDLRKERIVKEYIDGRTVYEMVLRDELPGACLMQIQEMCRLLYSANTNIDYFPTNFVWREESHSVQANARGAEKCEGLLYYIDYECNDYMEEWNFENWGVKYWSKTSEFLKYAEEHNR